MNKELGKLRSHIPSVIPPGQTYISEENFDKILNILRKDLIKLMVKKVSKNTAISADFIVETIEKQFMTQLLMDKLNSIDANANYYVHPSTHPAQIIITDENRRFVSDEEKALYTDKYTKEEVDNKLLQVLNSLDWKESVKTFADLIIKYPNPEEGWTVNVTNEDATYRWSKNENKWILISANSIPLVTELVDGLMRKEDYLKLLKLPDKITLDKRFLYKVNNSIGNTSEITTELSVDSLTTEGNYYIKVSNEYLWVFNDTRNKVVIQNKINTSGILMSRTGNIGNDNNISWQKWVKVNAGDGLSFKVYQPAHGFTFDAIRYNGTTQLYEIADITTGADGCAIKIDNDNFNFIIYGQGVIPIDATDDLSGAFLIDEFYFLSNTVSGKFQRSKPTSGLFQSIFHTRPSLETPGVILADINIGQPMRMSLNQISVDLAKKQNINEPTLKTTNKTIPGSINEIYDQIKDYTGVYLDKNLGGDIKKPIRVKNIKGLNDAGTGEGPIYLNSNNSHPVYINSNEVYHKGNLKVEELMVTDYWWGSTIPTIYKNDTSNIPSGSPYGFVILTNIPSNQTGNFILKISGGAGNSLTPIDSTLSFTRSGNVFSNTLLINTGFRFDYASVGLDSTGSFIEIFIRSSLFNSTNNSLICNLYMSNNSSSTFKPKINSVKISTETTTAGKYGFSIYSTFTTRELDTNLFMQKSGGTFTGNVTFKNPAYFQEMNGIGDSGHITWYRYDPSDEFSGKFQFNNTSDLEIVTGTSPKVIYKVYSTKDFNIKNYPTKNEINNILAQKSDINHNHDSVYAKLSGANFTGSVNINGTLTVTTGILCNGNVTAFVTSDERLKGEMKVILNPLDTLKDIHGYIYERPEAPGILEAGVKAQDFKNKYPYVLGSTEIKGESYLTVEYDKIIPLLIESIHELENKINNTLWNRFKRFMSSLFK
jgi:hypothetical protein